MRALATYHALLPRLQGPAPTATAVASKGALRADRSAWGDGAHAFCREGDYWSVTFERRTVRLKHTKGLGYIAYLLRTPLQEVHVLQLVAQAGLQASGASIASTPRDRLGRDLVPLSDQSIPVIDAQAFAQYRQRLRGLREELDDAERNHDLGRTTSLGHEMQLLHAQLAAASGYHREGSPRSIPTAASRARVAVRNNIATALKGIHLYHTPLWRHLFTAVRTGLFCSYAPEQPAMWDIRDSL
ncbi:MAG: hypothetical protein HYR72_22675 [Deltaproteobacteria bacterium]|nr:hypothetical protein [Deltaproteobacteria bacterium]MBI3390653.1 hypothetical protein [Deltaproteobacteria bacterium]